MELEFDRTDGFVVVTSCERVDGSNAKEFESAVREIIQDGDRAMVLDFKPLTYISSAGLRAILLTAKNLQKRGAKFGICTMAPPTLEIFAISGFDKIIDIYQTRTEAVASIGSKLSEH